MQSIWPGTISFGLIHIPIKLYSATKDRAFNFHFLRKSDLCPIKYLKVCRQTGEQVEFKDIVKGYEYRKGDYVIFEESDFKKADPEALKKSKKAGLGRSPQKRHGKVYLDYLQNNKGQTIASVYSLRSKPGATVSTPLFWDELNYRLDPLKFNIKTIFNRLKKTGEIFSGVLGAGINMGTVLRSLEDNMPAAKI